MERDPKRNPNQEPEIKDPQKQPEPEIMDPLQEQEPEIIEPGKGQEPELDSNVVPEIDRPDIPEIEEIPSEAPEIDEPGEGNRPDLGDLGQGQPTDEVYEPENSEYAHNDQFRTNPEYYDPKTGQPTSDKESL